MSIKKDATELGFDEVTIFGKPALFNGYHIDSNTVPKGYHIYEMRHDDNRGYVNQLAKRVINNFMGTLITRDEIKEVSRDGYLNIRPKALYFYKHGDCITLEEFMAKYPPNSEQNKESHDKARNLKTHNDAR